MNNEKTLAGALCAAEEVADAAQAAPAEGKKKYVPPRMEVIPLGPQRMLATSGEPPVQVSLYMLAGQDLYWVPSYGRFYYRDPDRAVQWESTDCTYSNGTWFCPGGTGMYVGTPDILFNCSDVVRGSSFLAQYADMVQDKGGITDCAHFGTAHDYAECGARITGYSLTPQITFSGADWDVQDFFANAEFDACSDEEHFSGTYQGQRFAGTIEY